MDKDLLEHVTVPASRLVSGAWKGEREADEGDIRVSYSADVIAMEGRVRTPFRHGSHLWACVSIVGRSNAYLELEAYRLTPQVMFAAPVTSYNAKLRIDGGDAARNDPNGFYHGMTVKHGGIRYVLTGPPSVFVPGPETVTIAAAQMSLFGEELR